MNIRKHKVWSGIAAIAFVGFLWSPDLAVAQENGGSQDVEVLTRGPVHEAFAGTVSYNPEPGIIVTAEVPEGIEEQAPEERPEGDNVTWIPGYWAWDEEQNDFLWISGIWRNLPPGRQWVPGYWSDVDGGYQWTSGYWEDAETTEVDYLPEPPRTLEVGPNIAAPSDDQTWIPGNWMWNDSRYLWRAGYWAPVRTNWIWMPGHYRWTRHGYLYVNGYWDYEVARRGVLFAPIHFHRHSYASPGYYYSPAPVRSVLVFSNHLFLRPTYGHYYFGDYYAPIYRDHGFYASYSYSTSRRGYDPIFSHDRWRNRDVRHWEKQRRDYYEFRRDHENARPPRTWAALNSLPKDKRGSRSDYAFAETLTTYASKQGDGRERFRKVDKNDRQRIAAQSQDVRKFANERKKLETSREPAAAEESSGNAKVTRAKFKRSPVVAKINENSDKSVAPPKRLEKRVSQPSRDTTRPDKTRPGRETQTVPDRKTDRKTDANKPDRSSDRTNVPPKKKQTSEPGRETKKKQASEPGRETKKKQASEPGRETKKKQASEPGRETKKRQASGPGRETMVPSPPRKTEQGTKTVPRPPRDTTPEVKRPEKTSPTHKDVPVPKKAEPVRPKHVEKTPAAREQTQRPTSQPSRKADHVQPQRPQPQPQPQHQAQPSPKRSKDQPAPDSDTSNTDDKKRSKTKH